MGRTSRRGIGLIEILIAVVLLGLLGAGITTTLVRSSERSADTVSRETARQLAEGWLSRIRAAGPHAYDLDRDSFPVSPAGERLAEASPYTLRVERVISCLGAVETGDGGTPVIDPTCTGTGRAPVVTYRVAAFYPMRSGDDGVVALATSFGESSGAVGVARSCPGGQRWDGSACACPAGMVFDGTLCGCPAGQAWSGISCVPSACSMPSGSAEIRTLPTCGAPRVGGTVERRDLDAATCAWGPWTLVSATCGCPNPGEVYSAVTNNCFVPPAPETRSLACPAGFAGARTEMRTFDIVNDTWGAWVETSNTCVAIPPCTPATETRTLACPVGQTGSINESRTQNATCSAWGAWIETSRSCVPAGPGPCTPATETRELSCPVGQTGSIYESRTQNATCSAWGAWIETSRSCMPVAHSLALTLTPSSPTPEVGASVTWTLGISTTGTVGSRSIVSEGNTSAGMTLAVTYAATGVREAVAEVSLTTGEYASVSGWVDVQPAPDVIQHVAENWYVTPPVVPVLISNGSLSVWMPYARRSWEVAIYRITGGWVVTELGRAVVHQTAGACFPEAGPPRHDGTGTVVDCTGGVGGWHTMVEHLSGAWAYPTGPFFVPEGVPSAPWTTEPFDLTSPLLNGKYRWYGITEAY